ncbi:MAG: hypothetical protein NC429_13335 [Lachnospiraceae bacterium]|nr:hypothetical protein [Lachnospiraceae bacterium]
MSKRVTNVTVKSVDGPTSVFLVGKERRERILRRIRKYLCQKKKNRIAKRIVADAHTLTETVSYIKEKYHAVEEAQQSRNYQEQRNSLKESLITRHKPELLGDLLKLELPKKQDKESLEEFLRLLGQRNKMSQAVPDEVFPVDFHLYRIDFAGIGEMEVMVEHKWEQFSISYSGDKKIIKQMREIMKDIYLYYGVTQEDIDRQTERYKSLLMNLYTFS